jgi:hypothetical protein
MCCLAGSLNWLRNAAPNLHPIFCCVRDLIKLRNLSTYYFILPAFARAELGFFATHLDVWEPTAFFPECPKLLLEGDPDGAWHLAFDFPPQSVTAPRLLSFITSDAAGGLASPSTSSAACPFIRLR